MVRTRHVLASCFTPGLNQKGCNHNLIRYMYKLSKIKHGVQSLGASFGGHGWNQDTLSGSNHINFRELILVNNVICEVPGSSFPFKTIQKKNQISGERGNRDGRGVPRYSKFGGGGGGTIFYRSSLGFEHW